MIGYLTQNYSLINAFGSPMPASTRRETSARNRVFKMAPKLSNYLSEDEVLAVKGNLSRPISGLAIDSRRVVPGNVFFALPGLRTNGVNYIDEAISRGAVAVVAGIMPRTTPAKITFVHAEDPRALVATMARRYNKMPDQDLKVVGITGTNGKTTVAHLVRHLIGGQKPVGLLGTIAYDLGARAVPSFKTTPEAIDTFGMLAQMRDAGCREAVMEVSSHGIDQQRINGLRFGVAVYTNLTRDHLDYHTSMDEYFEVKARLFTGEQGGRPAVSVINIDNTRGPELLARLAAHQARVTFGEKESAQVRAKDVTYGFKSTTFTLVWPQGERLVTSPLIGRYNLSNLLAAIATAYALGRDPAVMLDLLHNFTGVPGRMERIEEGQPFNVLVDYAHTDDALRNALAMLRLVTPGRLLVVFGCGGNRDRSKRAMMMKAVQERADFTFATADNPRREALSQIFADMETGVTTPEKLTWIEDRRRAISLALDIAKPGDSLLIAGKGHEPYQEFADTVVPFDDRLVARELIAIKRIARP
ncbi:MAG: UDP-N-acetylmuramoyl-L-alanyl-D-glutamate--2,6-diaminopimelate ligase [Candidatus Synoicihabitans palmerolidicus]|nr:UDP-N-acetylmuramoyl-L-alanyl-D-glutamate--2,6-diaminopimelate ligase [Candidatus Synoicihabitans palmerolidicus]